MADIDSNLPSKDASDGADGSAAPSLTQQVGGVDGSGNLQSISVNTSGAVNINDISGTVSLPTGAATSSNQTSGAQKTQIVDGSGNVIGSLNNQLAVEDILNTAGQYRAQTVTASAAEALGGAVILANRKMLSITPTDGTIYWGFNSSVTTSSGSPIFKNQTVTFSVGANLHIYVIAASSINCRMAEAS